MSTATPTGRRQSKTRAWLSPILPDVAVWIVATDVAAVARYDFIASDVHWPVVSVLALLLAAAQVAVGSALLLYGGRYQTGSFDEARPLAVTATSISVLATTVVLLLHPSGLPRSLPSLAWPMAMLGMAGIRFTKRLLIQANNMPGREAERLLVLGAGWVGATLVQQMLRSPGSEFLPVGFLDDDPAKRQLQICGVRVHGRFEDLATVARKFEVSKVVVAVNNADAALMRGISDRAHAAGLTCLVMPPLKDVLRPSQLRLSAIREVDVEDVIGRRAVETDVASIAHYITGRRVLVTGAGGSIGSELCQQLHRFRPEELILLDRDESALHALELSLYGRALLDSSSTVLADIRDRSVIERVFAEHRPDVVFHAAALKHLTLLERYPRDALRSNVYGTLNVLQAALDAGVEHLVNVSTDKAANPASALGHSKRLAERLTAWYALQYDTKFLSVRFGNVLGSRGSVLPAFAAQIEAGGPVTVTDPDVCRYFMTIPEACELVIQAGAIGRSGEALVLDMGEPVKIVDIAARMIKMSGRDIDIVFTGLRAGEKLTEERFGYDELGVSPFHPMVSHVTVPPVDPDQLRSEPWVRLAMSSDELVGVPVQPVIR